MSIKERKYQVWREILIMKPKTREIWCRHHHAIILGRRHHSRFRRWTRLENRMCVFDIMCRIWPTIFPVPLNPMKNGIDWRESILRTRHILICQKKRENIRFREKYCAWYRIRGVPRVDANCFSANLAPDPSAKLFFKNRCARLF
jgi:hypothetical protein